MRRRPQVFWICMIVLVAISALAASLHDVHFVPGLTFAARQSLKVPDALPVVRVITETPVWRIILFWLGGVAYLVLFLFLLPAYLRKRILRQLLSLAIGVLALLLALHFRILQLPDLFGGPAGLAAGDTSGSATVLPVPDFRTPTVAPWVAYVVSLVVVWVLALLGWFLARRWRGSPGRDAVSLSAIEDIARSSLGDLAAGRSWADVVVEAYARMSEAVGVRRGLKRHHASTPREFAGRLARAGLPADAVGGLTRLFESVRYGGRSSSESEVEQAVSYLESILRACEAAA